MKQYLRFGLIIFALATFSTISGCSQEPAKKPADNPVTPELAAEVKQYTAEPSLTLYRKGTGQIQELPLEKYIEGVVGGEIGDKFPDAALEAQSIVARTMTLALINYEGDMRTKRNADASDDHTEFQAYNEKAVTDRIRQAVEKTRGQVLTNNGKFVYTEFHSVSNQKTAAIEEAFPKLKDKAPYLVPVPTNGINYAPEKYRNWTVKIGRWEVAKAIGLKNSLYSLTIYEYGPSGRALFLSANDGAATMHAAEFRQAVGFDRLYSTFFSDIRLEGDYVIFQGSGWGHGSGMEQWGAYGMADEGKTAEEIVLHYYPKSNLTQLYQ